MTTECMQLQIIGQLGTHRNLSETSNKHLRPIIMHLGTRFTILGKHIAGGRCLGREEFRGRISSDQIRLGSRQKGRRISYQESIRNFIMI